MKSTLRRGKKKKTLSGTRTFTGSVERGPMRKVIKEEKKASSYSLPGVAFPSSEEEEKMLLTGCRIVRSLTLGGVYEVEEKSSNSM